MGLFKVVVTETVVRTFEVEAFTAQHAEAIYSERGDECGPEIDCECVDCAVSYVESADEPSVCLAGNPREGDRPCGDPACVCS